MTLTAEQRRFLTAVANLGYSNPFLPERITHERTALGDEFISSGPVWSASVSDPDATPPNLTAIYQKLNACIDDLPAADLNTDLNMDDRRIYHESVHYLLYQRYHPHFVAAQNSPAKTKWRFYREFLNDWNQLILPTAGDAALHPAHVFACYRQIQLAFHHIYDNIIGNSMPAARLRAAIWQSIFTHDMRRYRRTMYRKMAEFPTLITGPSGTGKELIARAIAGARYVEFDAERMEFKDHTIAADTFLPINIAALSPTLIESELFGHKRGSFTGAIGDRKGWLEACPQTGSVFLDELGEMDLAIQVKLLRVIETRRFSPVGDTTPREFKGKLIAATNRHLEKEMQSGRFREDLYYRMCADLIQTPSLAEQIADTPCVLQELVGYMTRRTVSPDTSEADRCLPEVQAWIDRHLPRDYPWPGNYRELEQCVRNIVIRGSYQPVKQPVTTGDEVLSRFRAAEFTADQLLSHYAAHVYRITGSYEEAARKMQLDRRTVKAKVESYLSSKSGGPIQSIPK